MKIFILTKNWANSDLSRLDFDNYNILILCHPKSSYDIFFKLSQNKKIKLIKPLKLTSSALLDNTSSKTKVVQQLLLIKNIISNLKVKHRVLLLLLVTLCFPFITIVSLFMDLYYILIYKLPLYISKFTKSNHDFNLNFNIVMLVLLRAIPNIPTPKKAYKGSFLARFMQKTKVIEAIRVKELEYHINQDLEIDEILTDDAGLCKKLHRKLIKKTRISIIKEFNTYE